MFIDSLNQVCCMERRALPWRHIAPGKVHVEQCRGGVLLMTDQAMRCKADEVVSWMGQSLPCIRQSAAEESREP